MSAHSVLPPSSAHIWGAPGGCTGWPTMSAHFPEEETEDTLNGSASHWVGEKHIHDFVASRSAPLQGLTAPNGVILTEEMIDAAMIYAEDVRAEIMEYPHAAWGTEVKIHAPLIHPQNYGTTDAYLFAPLHNLLIVWDYKFGRKIVEAFMNWQGVNYVAGLIGLLGITDPALNVEIRIIQPRAFHRDGPIRVWKTTAGALVEPVGTLSTNAHIALSDRAETRSGSHCVYCTARHACTAAVTSGWNLYEAVSRPIPVGLTPQQLGTQLNIVRRAREQLEYLESGYQEQVKSLVRSGKVVPGWGVKTGLGKRKWDRPDSEVLQLGDLMGVDLREPLKPISPAKAEKRGLDSELVAAYTRRDRTGITLVPDDNNKAREVFSR